MKKGILWARVSSKEQEEGYSIDAQLKPGREYAKKEKIRIFKEYAVTESAKRAGRREFNQMLEEVKEFNLDFILAEKTDRLYRNLKDWVVLDDMMENSNLEIHLWKEGSLLSKDSHSTHKLHHGINVMVAKYHLDNAIEETRKGMLERAEKGWLPGLAPNGYENVPKTKKTPGKIIIDSERAHFVRKAFERYSTGEFSLSTLNELLYQEGFRAKNGGRLSEHGLQKILKNHFYYGWFEWSGQFWKGSHEPLISKHLFDKVQSIFADRASSQWKGKWFAFKGLLRCGFCGCAITAETIKGKYTYYRCTYGKGYCEQRIRREEEIDSLFAEALDDFYLDDKIIKWAKEGLIVSHEEEEAESKARLIRLKREHSRNESYIHKIYQDRLQDIITPEFFQSEFNEIQERQQMILYEMEREQNRNKNYIEEGIMLLELMQGIKEAYLKANLRQKSRMLKMILERCELNGEEPSFHWKKPFDILYGGFLKTEEWGE